MSSTGINTLTTGTINGLNSLALDELTTNTFTSGTISGDLFYIDRVEAKEVIVDTRLTLTNTGVISVGDKFISDIELTYLDGVTSNIQAQINAVSGAESGLASTVALHTTQITALQSSDTSQNTLLGTHTTQITALQSSDTSQNTLLGTHTTQINALNYAVEGQIANINTHTTQITALQSSDTSQNTLLGTHTTQINALNYAVEGQIANINTHTTQITALQTSDGLQNTAITNLQTSDGLQNNKILEQQVKTQYINVNSTTMSFNTDIINMNSGQNNVSITTAANALLESSNSMQWKTKAVFFGSDIPLHNYYTTVGFYNLLGTDWEYQHSAFTEQLKQNVLSHNSKTQYQSTTATSTDFSKQINFTNGNIGYINSLYPNNFYIQSTLASGNNIVLNSGSANVFLQSQNVYLGKEDATTGRKSNLFMYSSEGEYEIQSSAFTEELKTQIGTNASNITELEGDVNTLQNQIYVVLSLSGTVFKIIEDVADLETKTQWQTSNSTSTSFSKQVNFPNGNIGYVNSSLPTAFHIQSSLVSGDDMYIKSGLGFMYLEGFAVRLGNQNLPSGRKSRLQMLADDGITWEAQNSAFTETLKSQIGTNTTNIGTNTAAIATNTAAIATNTAAIGINTTAIGTNTAAIGTLETKTQWQTSNSNSTTFSKQIKFPNGNIGYENILYPNNFYIQSSGENNIVLNSGLANITLQSQNIYLGKEDATTGRKSNLHLYSSNGTYEIQSSAFTETLKTQIGANAGAITDLQTNDTQQDIDISGLKSNDVLQDAALVSIQNINATQNTAITALQTSDTTQNTSITALQSKTQNISSANTTSTNMSKPLYITSVDALRLYGNHGYISGWSNVTNNRDWYFGTADTNNKKLVLQNEREEGIYLQTGTRSGVSGLGQNKIYTYSNGLSLRRGGLNTALLTVGEIGATGGTTGTDAHLYINGNSTNNIIIDSGIGTITLQAQHVYLGRLGATGRKSNLYMYSENDSTYEVQSSAFTEVLKAKIIENSVDIDDLQYEDTLFTASIQAINAVNATQTTNITALQTSNTANTSAITALQTSDTANTSAITALQTSDTANTSAITALQNKTQNISNSTTSATTIMDKPLYIDTSDDCLRLYGPNSFISAYRNSVPKTRDWYIGTMTTNSKQLQIGNEKQEGIYLKTGSSSTNTNLGQNKIVTHSTGISLRRGGITLSDTELIVGEIGATSSVDEFLRINGNGTNSIALDSGLGAIYNTTNALYVSSTIANGNTGRKSNIFMYDSTGTSFEIQSSAFTEALKTNVLSISKASAFGGNKGKITLARNFQIMGQTSLLNGATYNNSTTYNVGAQLNSLYPALFLSNGKYSGSEGDMNVNISFQFGFLCKNSSITIFKSYFEIRDTNNGLLDLIYTQGVHYNSASTLNNALYYNLGPLKHIIKEGHQILLVTTYNLTMGNQSPYAMDSVFTIERNPL